MNKKNKNKKCNLPKILLVLYCLIFILSAKSPFDVSTWFIEIIPILSIVIFLIFTYSKFKFSNFSYILMFIGLVWHTVGAHYTFERVPFDFINDLFGFTRNNYDRFGHFFAGFYAVPTLEYMYKKRLVKNLKTAFLFGLFTIGFVAASYEIIEYLYAIIFGGSSAQNFLGSQGDSWDAQWDMLMDISGALTSLSIYGLVNKSNT